MEAVSGCVENLPGLLEENELAERKAFNRSFIGEVKVTGNEVMLPYAMPLTPEKISEEQMGVLYSVNSSGNRVTIGRTFELVFSLII